MGMIRRYGDLPAVFVPDEGEVVLASRSPAGPYLRVAVVKVRRRYEGFFRVDYVYLEDHPASPTGTGHRVGDKGYAYIRKDDRIPLIRRIPAV